MKIAVAGAGAWGTAVALAASRHPAGHQVLLWARDAAQARAMQDQRENVRYLPGIALPDTLRVEHGVQALQHAAQAADLIVIATPVAGLRAMLVTLRDAWRQPGSNAQSSAHPPMAWLCKGFEPVADTAAPSGTDQSTTIPAGLLPHEIQQQIAPDLHAGALSGPSFAQEVARGQPTALVAAGH
ncbi:MAG: hypothetical protein LBH31_10045, partial [Burkholderiaceae bacterium]|nr:hypothetical protein [Burkholderiaceae bacterium]